MNIKNFLLVITMTTAATSMQAMNQQGAGAGAGAPQGGAGQAMQLPAIGGLQDQPWHIQAAGGVVAGYMAAQQAFPQGAGGAAFRTRVKNSVMFAAQTCADLLTQQAVIDDAIAKTKKLIDENGKSKLSAEEQAAFVEAEIRPLLKLYCKLGLDKVNLLELSEKAGKSPEAVALALSKQKTAATFGVLLEYYILMNPELFEETAEKKA